MSRPKAITKSTSSSEDFSKAEIKRFGNRNISFIKGIQRSEGLNKKEAISLFNQKKKGRKSDFKRFQRKIRKNAFNYGEKSVLPSGDYVEKSHKKPKTKGEPDIKVKSESKPKKTITQWRKEEKKKISDYLQSVKFRNSPTYEKVKSGHKIYPDASKYELVHGINSKASQEFRLKHGLNSDYKGKVKK